MKLSCPSCGHAADIPDDRLPPVGARGKCGGCQQPFVFDGHGLRDEDATPDNPLAAVDDSGGPADPDATPDNPLPALADDELPSAPGLPGPPPVPTTPATGPGPAASRARAGAAVAVATASGWVVRTAAGESQPLELHELKALIRDGHVEPWHQVRPPGAETWGIADENEDLHRYFVIRKRVAANRSASDEPVLPRCARHLSTNATHQCSSCQATLCEACLVVRDIGTVQNVATCPACEGACRPLEKPKVLVPFTKELKRVFRYPVKGLGWIAIVVLTFLWGLSLLTAWAPGFIGFVGTKFLHACIFAYVLFVIRDTADGGRSLPEVGDVSDWKGEVFWPGIRAIFVSFMVLVPYYLYANLHLAPTVAAYAADSAFAEAQEQADENDRGRPDDGAGDGDALANDFDGNTVVSMEEEAMAEAMASMLGSAPPGSAAPPGEATWEPEGGWDDEQWSEDAEATAFSQRESTTGFDVLLAVLGLLGVLAYALIAWPILLILVALFNTVLPVFRPDLVFRIAGEVRKEYGRLLLFLLAVALPMLLMMPFVTTNPLARILLHQALPGVFFVIAPPIFFYMVLVIAHAMGRVAEEMEQKIEWA